MSLDGYIEINSGRFSSEKIKQNSAEINIAVLLPAGIVNIAQLIVYSKHLPYVFHGL